MPAFVGCVPIYTASPARRIALEEREKWARRELEHAERRVLELKNPNRAIDLYADAQQKLKENRDIDLRGMADLATKKVQYLDELHSTSNDEEFMAWDHEVQVKLERHRAINSIRREQLSQNQIGGIPGGGPGLARQFWHWQGLERLTTSFRYTPGKRMSTYCVLSNHYDNKHYPWIQESVRLRSRMLRLMYRDYADDDKSPEDIVNGLWALI